jgi:hypothetical protein
VRPLHNPQTMAFCALAGIRDPTAPFQSAAEPMRRPLQLPVPTRNPDEIQLGDDDDHSGGRAAATAAPALPVTSSEIVLEDDDEDVSLAPAHAAGAAPHAIITGSEIRLGDDDVGTAAATAPAAPAVAQVTSSEIVLDD